MGFVTVLIYRNLDGLYGALRVLCPKSSYVFIQKYPINMLEPRIGFEITIRTMTASLWIGVKHSFN